MAASPRRAASLAQYGMHGLLLTALSRLGSQGELKRALKRMHALCFARQAGRAAVHSDTCSYSMLFWVQAAGITLMLFSDGMQGSSLIQRHPGCLSQAQRVRRALALGAQQVG